MLVDWLKADRLYGKTPFEEHSRETAEAVLNLAEQLAADCFLPHYKQAGINDAASAVVLATSEAVRRYGLQPLARLISYGFAGVDPAHMGIGPVPATRIVLERAGLHVGDLDVIESNKAFASQACAVIRSLGFDPDWVNPNGSGISLGHPAGATGAIITTKLVHELHRSGGRYGLATMCIGGGQGIAAIFERYEFSIEIDFRERTNDDKTQGRPCSGRAGFGEQEEHAQPLYLRS
ncbi:beta-ketothiolase [Pseudomonas alkylphenolica]|uniref:acetyl-CoA C-acyltransferase n=1 Tax=Pseudomonas alkylphenolica TaxID=237609 RepID=A0A077FE80_9PSED|nr:beta-ketothiolase [Pseudomonas alkylphenolica]